MCVHVSQLIFAFVFKLLLLFSETMATAPSHPPPPTSQVQMDRNTGLRQQQTPTAPHTKKKKPSMSISRSHTSTAWIFTNPSHETRGGQRGDGEFKQAAERWVRGGWYRGETCFYACNLILESSGLQLCVSLCASYKIWCLRVRYEILLSVWKWMQLMH